MAWLRRPLALLVVLLVGACGGLSESDDEGACASVTAAEVIAAADGSYTVNATVRSNDTGWEAYADHWEVLVDGQSIATRILLHPHVDEQPFTRSLTDVDLPAGTRELTIRAHHSVGGFCGEPFVFGF